MENKEERNSITDPGSWITTYLRHTLNNENRIRVVVSYRRSKSDNFIQSISKKGKVQK